MGLRCCHEGEEVTVQFLLQLVEHQLRRLVLHGLNYPRLVVPPAASSVRRSFACCASVSLR